MTGTSIEYCRRCLGFNTCFSLALNNNLARCVRFKDLQKTVDSAREEFNQCGHIHPMFPDEMDDLKGCCEADVEI